MANQGKGQRGKKDEPKQAFVSQDDRPEVKLDLDRPVNELRVRDLAAILGLLSTKSPFEVGKTPIKDFFDKEFPEVAKDYIKELKPEKVEKNEKLEKNEKIEKSEKQEKSEIKELKAEKVENDGVFDLARSDPRMEQIIQAVTGLTRQVTQLANQVEELRKKVSG